jgi:transcriptional regulator with XRE-family HTH domain
MLFKDLVKQKRNEKGLRQIDVGEKLGINQVTVGDYERGKTYPEMNRLKVLCELLDIDFEVARRQIITEKEEKTITKAKKRTSAFLTTPTFATSNERVDDDDETEAPGLEGLPILRVLDSPDKNLIDAEYRLTKTQMLIGRESRTAKEPPDIPIPTTDKTISRNHAYIRKEGDHFVIRDYKAKNRTEVNGEEIVGDKILEHGAQLQMGETRFEFDDGRNDR